MAKKVTKADLDRSARELLGFLERNIEEEIFKYPFSALFPQNCCVGVSLILAYLFEEKYGLDHVRVIKGTSDEFEHHLWVTVDSLTYDLTVHQFHGQEPVIPLDLRSDSSGIPLISGL